MGLEEKGHMASWRIECEGRQIATPSSLQDLEAALLTIAQGAFGPNPTVDLVHPAGHILTIGISGERGFLNYSDASLDPPYYSSVGDPSLPVEAGMAIFHHGEPTEIPLRNCIPVDVLLAAVKEYFLTGTLSTSVEWEPD